MKHAGPSALDRLEPFLSKLRTLSGLKEKSRGVFYVRSRAFLHFHEDGDAFYADVRFANDFERIAATSIAERAALLKRVRAYLADGIAKPTR
jgi:hypothetical protein